MDKEKLLKAMIESMPDSLTQEVKEDIAKIMMKVMEAVEGESIMGGIIALDILKSFLEDSLKVELKSVVKVDKNLDEIFNMFMNTDEGSGTVH